MTLYHYTCLHHLPTILRAGYLNTTESNVSLLDEHIGPDVVWLTTDPAVRVGLQGLGGPERPADWNKTRVRFEIAPEVEVEKWFASDLCEQMSDWERRALIRAAGGVEFSDTWWVAYQPIPRSQWIAVEVDGEPRHPYLPAGAVRRRRA